MNNNEDKQIAYMSPYDVEPYADNIRKHDESDLAVIRKSIKDYGFQDPVTVDPYMTIIEGHGRVMIAKEFVDSGELIAVKTPNPYVLKNIPVIISDLEGDNADEYRIVHNKTGEIAGYDMDKYQRVIDELVERCQFEAEAYQLILPENPVNDLLDNVMGDPDSKGDGTGETFDGVQQHKLIITCNNEADVETILARLSDMEIIVHRVD